MEGWHSDLRSLIEQADPDNSTLLSIRVVEPRERWMPGSVTLLGDAIHATSPTGGNGASTALRDADLLRRCLIEAAEGRQDRERLAISGTDGVTLVIYHAEAGSSDAEKLALLGSSALTPADGIDNDISQTHRTSLGQH
jgi:hypothetical protein